MNIRIFVALVFALILCTLFESCFFEKEKERIAIEKLGTIDAGIVESTPIVFHNKLYRFEYIREHYHENVTGESFFRFIDYETGEPISTFASSYHLGSAFESQDSVYVSAVNGWGGDKVVLFVSSDLMNWDKRIALHLPENKIFNTSICKADEQYTMMYEIGGPPEEAGKSFTARFAHSEDLSTWITTTPDHNYTKDRYSAPHALKFHNGHYYNFHLEKNPFVRKFETYVVRSKDLKFWEMSPFNPVLKPSESDKIVYNMNLPENFQVEIQSAINSNNSDIDFCEIDGSVLINYSWGDQKGNEYLAEAIFRGSLIDFLTGWFPEY